MLGVTSDDDMASLKGRVTMMKLRATALHTADLLRSSPVQPHNSNMYLSLPLEVHPDSGDIQLNSHHITSHHVAVPLRYKDCLYLLQSWEPNDIIIGSSSRYEDMQSL